MAAARGAVAGGETAVGSESAGAQGEALVATGRLMAAQGAVVGGEGVVVGSESARAQGEALAAADRSMAARDESAFAESSRAATAAGAPASSVGEMPAAGELSASSARRGPAEVVVSGMSVFSAFGPGVEPLLRAALDGTSGFAPVERFDVGLRRAKVAAVAPGSPELVRELIRTIDEACDEARLSRADRAAIHLFLAIHGDPTTGADAFAAGIAAACGFAGVRAYTSACVAASTAAADAAALIAHGRVERVVVAAGYLVDADQYALFDAGRALATDGHVRPFSVGRSGLLLGDAVGAIVLEASGDAEPLARLAGWGRSGDAYHVCKPRPDGLGLARAITDALHRGGVEPADIGYINAHGSGTKQSDVAESAGLRAALGGAAAKIPVSSTKSIHGQALEAGALLELILTIAALRAGRLPLNVGYLGPDDDCALALVLEPAAADLGYALTLNVAFGGANTALLVGAP